MEQENLSRPEPGPGQCGSDREVFERVWRRVMPTDRPDCPFTLYSDDERRRMAALLETGSAESAAPAEGGLPPQPAPPEAAVPCPPQTEEENDVPCLGAASAVYGGLLQEFIVRETADWRTYQFLARRAPGPAGRALASIAADERRHIKRLSTAYFLISGVRFQPEQAAPALPGGCTYFSALRLRFVEEQKGQAAYRSAAERSADPCLRELFLELAGDEYAHACLLRGLLEQA